MIELKKNKDYWVIGLNRPEVHNAFHPDMISELKSIFTSIEKEDLQFVVLKGNGKSFSAGADLNWMKSMIQYSEKENYEDALNLFDMFLSIYNCPLPTVCLAHGNVYGGGLGFLACCDFVISEKNTKFCFSEVKWGLSPATISPFLRSKISESAAKRWMLSAEVFNADEARNMGLIHEVSDNLEESLNHLTKNLFQNGTSAMKLTKSLLHEQGIRPERFRESTAKAIAKVRVSFEGQEGLKFFVDKKEPSWKKKSEKVDIL